MIKPRLGWHPAAPGAHPEAGGERVHSEGRGCAEPGPGLPLGLHSGEQRQGRKAPEKKKTRDGRSWHAEAGDVGGRNGRATA